MRKLLFTVISLFSLNVFASDDLLRDYVEEHKGDMMRDSLYNQQTDAYANERRAQQEWHDQNHRNNGY